MRETERKQKQTLTLKHSNRLDRLSKQRLQFFLRPRHGNIFNFEFCPLILEWNESKTDRQQIETETDKTVNDNSEKKYINDQHT